MRRLIAVNRRDSGWHTFVYIKAYIIKPLTISSNNDRGCICTRTISMYYALALFHCQHKMYTQSELLFRRRSRRRRRRRRVSPQSS